jgi:hypothetical protein
MRKTLLTALMAGILPVLAVAKETPYPSSGSNGLHFIENKGQVHDQYNNPRNDIQFSIGSKGMTAFIGDGQIHYQFRRVINPGRIMDPKKMLDKNNRDEKAQMELYRMDVELIGANKHAEVVREQEQSFTNNFFRSHFTSRNSKGVRDYQLKAHAYDKITYKDIYPNIDWVIYVKNDKVEYEFVVKQGGNPANIKLKYSGATSLSINKDGSLTAVTPLGTVNEKAPFSFQADGRVVTSSYSLDGNILSFNVGDYTGTLTIDPTLTWGTYFGDTGLEEYKGVQYDGTGNIYLIGYTNSVTNMATVGAFAETNAGGNDILITKIAANGNLVWSTFFGSFAEEIGWGLHWNGTDLVFAGITDVFGDNDAYFGNINSTGDFSDFDWVHGDIGDDRGFSVTRDGSNMIYVGMWTTGDNLVGDVGQMTFGGGTYDGMLLQLDQGGSYNLSTFLGGAGDDAIISVYASPNNSIYVGGWTSSTTAIATSGVFQQFAGGGFDGFLGRYNTSLTKQMCTYWGGSADDNILAVTADGSNVPHVAGLTSSTTGISVSGWQSTLSGTEDMMVGKFTAAGMATWGTYYGGPGAEEAYAIGVDNSGNVFVGGATNSSTNVAMGGGYDLTFGGVTDGALIKFNSGGTPQWATYYGGAGLDQVNGVDPDNASFVYAAAYSESAADVALNTTIQLNYAGAGDAVAAKFADCTLPAQPGTITGSASVCAGSTQTYSITAVPGATSYTWILPSGWTGTSTTNSISVTVGTTGGTISVAAVNGCGTGTAQTLNVTVNPIPTATITPAGPTTFCQGGNVVLNASTGTGYSYAWFQGVTPVGTNSSSYTANASGNYTVQITANGCSATSSAVTVTVNPLPNATATSNSPVCAGQTINLDGGSTTPGATYSWLGPLVFGSGLEDPSISNAQAGNAGTYTLTVTANGCTNTATTNVVVTTGAPATPSAINGDISICANSTGNIYDVTNDPNAASYTWTLPTGWTGSSTTNSITTTAGAAGNVQISVAATNGCGTSAAQTLNVTVNPNPTATITQSGNTLTVTGTFTSYQWYDGSGAISGATSQSYTPTVSGNYYCIVTDANGCTATSNTITVTVSVNNVVKVSTVTLYPNPNTGSFTIEGAFASNDGKANVVIVDVAGRVVYEQQVLVNNGKVSARIDMTSSIAAGVYTIKVSSDAANAVMPFVKN